MFEGKQPFSRRADGQPVGDSTGEELSALSWPDLVAKFNAARDLREELALDDTPGIASFDAFSAQHLASLPGAGPHDGKRGVNPDDLANGKGPRCKGAEHSDGDDMADRGNT